MTNRDCMLSCSPVAADSGCVAWKNFWESLESGLTKQKKVLNYRPMRFAGELRNEPERSGAQKKFWKSWENHLTKRKMVLNYSPIRFAGEFEKTSLKEAVLKKVLKKLRKSLDKTKIDAKLWSLLRLMHNDEKNIKNDLWKLNSAMNPRNDFEIRKNFEVVVKNYSKFLRICVKIQSWKTR